MFGNWYEMYWHMRERQKELSREAERLRLIAPLQRPGHPRKAAKALVHRLGLLLIRWGTALQQHGSSVP